MLLWSWVSIPKNSQASMKSYITHIYQKSTIFIGFWDHVPNFSTQHSCTIPNKISVHARLLVAKSMVENPKHIEEIYKNWPDFGGSGGLPGADVRRSRVAKIVEKPLVFKGFWGDPGKKKSKNISSIWPPGRLIVYILFVHGAVHRGHHTIWFGTHDLGRSILV